MAVAEEEAKKIKKIHITPEHILARGNCLCQNCGQEQPIGAVIPCSKCKKPLLYSCAWHRSFQSFYDSFKDFRIEALTRLRDTDNLTGFDQDQFSAIELGRRDQALKKRIQEEKYWAKRRVNG